MGASQAPAATTAQAAHPVKKAAARLEQEAKGHMRLSHQHRERAKTLYRELEELQRRCAEYGIELELTDHPRAKGLDSGN
jgi:sugar phosphate isomerase/epimerase